MMFQRSYVSSILIVVLTLNITLDHRLHSARASRLCLEKNLPVHPVPYYVHLRIVLVAPRPWAYPSICVLAHKLVE